VSPRVTGKLVWIDADVIPINTIDEVFERDFDVAITARSKLEETHSAYGAVNSGVLFFNTNSETIRRFVDAWTAQIESMPLAPNREQEAVMELFREAGESFEQYFHTIDLELGPGKITGVVLPCLAYNHYNFEAGVNPAENKILHFKAGKSEANREVIEDIRKGKLSKWTRYLSED